MERVADGTLAEQLEERYQYALRNRSAQSNATMAELVDELRRSRVAQNAPRPGQRAPDFALPDARGQVVTLGEVLTRGSAVVAFYRGGWCPYCNLQLRAYQTVIEEIHDLGGELVAISPQLPDGSLSTAETNQLSFPVLSDVGNEVARAFDLVFDVPAAVQDFYRQEKDVDLEAINGEWRLPVPATFVIGSDQIVRVAHVDPDYVRRLEPAVILDALRAHHQ